MTRRRLPGFYQQVAGGVVATVLAALGTRLAEPWVHLNASLVVTANIVMLLAGIGFMGAIQDALSGFFVTGGARVLEAVLATAGILAGVSGGLSLCSRVGLEIPRLVLPRFDLVGVRLGRARCRDRCGRLRLLLLRTQAHAAAGRRARGRGDRRHRA
ncbi:threonine/serine exporter family protein [Nocardioides convexus]|uniref:threonine/serine exporter family protein n=1 Tax=Nocardioides convexus TaxID=2712224 RepID=UPI002418A9A0|nr:threonine/serine exporter family protein [Nocardioides convexus]